MTAKLIQTAGLHNLVTPHGTFAVNVPNSVVSAKGFYVSFNDRDHAVYGGDTTALVLGQMEQFYILRGDHREAYAQRINHGLQACIEYYLSQADRIHPFSNHMPA